MFIDMQELEQDRYSLRRQLDQQKKLYENALETIESDALQHKSVVEALKAEYNVKVDQLTKEVHRSVNYQTFLYS